MNQYKDAQFECKPSGHILVDNVEVAVTLQCCHCNAHFVSIKGSGKIRGFCMRCMRVTCGKPACDPCVPFEARLDHHEGRKTQYDKLIRDHRIGLS